MKIKDLITKINPSTPSQTWFSLEKLAEELELYGVFNGEIPEKFDVNYNSQIIHKYVWWKDQLVEVVKTHFPYTQGSRDYFDRVDILFEGIKLSVNVNELQLDWGYPTKDEKIV